MNSLFVVEMAELVESELDISVHSLQFCTDSKVILGYIYNQTRQFYVYVSNRLQRIRESTKPKQWHLSALHRIRQITPPYLYLQLTRLGSLVLLSCPCRKECPLQKRSHTTLSLQMLMLRCILMLPRFLFFQLTWDVGEP